MKRAARIGIIAASIVAAGILATAYYRHSELYPSTDDAYVDADVVGIVAQVAGPIVNLPIEDNQAVSAGDLLFEIDPRPFRIAVEKAHAQLDKTGQNVSGLADDVTSADAYVRNAQANLRLAEVQWKRIEPLAKIGAVPFQDKDKAQAGLAEARAALADAVAQRRKALSDLGAVGVRNVDIRTALSELEYAELQLSYTRVVAPVNGYVTDLSLSPGSYANVGSPILSLVNTDSWRVVAYMKETQLRVIRSGQQTRVFLPAYPGVRFDGRVQGWGVEQQNSEGELGQDGVPSVSPTVDWVRMAQRFPVRITLGDPDPVHPLRKGMRASLRIDASAEPASGDDTGGS
ncbi:MAG: HlyD family secretion protein [Deltaproteobacteria bacterium]|nr:HlyD family secretion protein [Deltaproteobacteria bacterium]